jgi:hypothetical protein
VPVGRSVLRPCFHVWTHCSVAARFTTARGSLSFRRHESAYPSSSEPPSSHIAALPAPVWKTTNLRLELASRGAVPDTSDPRRTHTPMSVASAQFMRRSNFRTLDSGFDMSRSKWWVCGKVRLRDGLHVRSGKAPDPLTLISQDGGKQRMMRCDA